MHKDEWNQFVAQSKNGTFLFDRRYMDYHSDRFHDYSLMFYRNGKLYALLPANITEEQDVEGHIVKVLYSHQGLTYGGLVMDMQARTTGVLQIFRELNDYLHNAAIQKVVYKPTPWIYHRMPAEEDIYAIFNVCNAKRVCCEVSTTIDLQVRPRWSELRRRCARKAQKAGIKVTASADWRSFWQILNDNLWQKYRVHPVHSLAELQLLASRFPDHIRLTAAFLNEEMVGGIITYTHQPVVHSQYIAASSLGKQSGAIDAIMTNLLEHTPSNTFYFDFGKSTEEQGDTLNESLISQKEGFGGRAVCYDTYEWGL